VLLNVVPTHLDYHGGMQDYIASKLRLFINMRAGDTAVLNADDPVCNYVAAVLRGHELSLKHENALGTDVRSAFAELRRVFATVPRDERPRVVLFSVTKELESGVFARPPYPAELGAPDPVRTGRELIWQLDGSQDYVRIVPTADMGLPGQHNVANSAAAVSALLGAGLSASEFAEPLKTFRGVEHRLEFVVEHDGIRYYNNSKATNAVAATISLYSFPAGKIVLICGGIDRGEDFKSLVPHLTKQAKAMVTMGETREVLAWRGRAAGLTGVVIVEPKESAADTLYQAVREATNLASPGDVVLLSPACASWDQFTSYEERGRIFKEAAHKL
jgi:UDP-N-acetylmuramoylalanine--D-glutamate ligase